MKKITAEDAWVAAQTAWGEARGEGTEGMQAVLLVIRNRAMDRRWSMLSVAAVCRQPAQFSAWNAGDVNRPRMLALSLENEAFRDCLAMAIEVFSGQTPDVVEGATHYYADTIATPYWAQGKEPVAHIGHHLFFAGIA